MCGMEIQLKWIKAVINVRKLELVHSYVNQWEREDMYQGFTQFNKMIKNEWIN